MAKRDKLFLPQTHPRLLEEWDYHKNRVLGLDPNKLTAGSHKKAWWVCQKCGHGWPVKINNRTGLNSGCPSCSGNIVSDKNRLSLLYPELVKEWHLTRNGSLVPEEVSFGSGRKVWWLCKECKYEWPAVIGYRTTNESGCPACSGKAVSDKNRLSLLYPELAKEWHPTKNSRLKPEDVSIGCEKRAWWLCKEGHGWSALIYNRATNKSGCSVCSGGSSVSKISQEWLDSIDIPQEYREFSIKVAGKTYKVDGFDTATNTVYEFLGKYYHGDLRFFRREEMNPTVGKTFGKLYDQTFQRFAELEKAGYKVVYIWENDYKYKGV